ncbi:MAG: 3-keto-5-aminohexanoate cleavage protein [Myxococcota bacterium]|nr:3-keto-5-aminohexanoate cleavage protein [Myxococcota bacterium]
MVGNKVLLRVRMSAHDAHYAGELVDGARILALFGDLATEILVRLDGDEGLFRAYESVDFLGPVFAGDYIEATAELVAIGDTSRKIRFEARKVLASVRRSGTPPSAVDVLDEPTVVARALGTCVVPKELQRRTRELSAPGLPAGLPPWREALVTPPGGGRVILTAAIVGAELTRDHTRHVPFTAEEVADEAARCREAGAAIVHLHVRDDQGHNTQSAERFAEVIDAIERKCDCIIQASTGGAVGMSVQERSGPLACRPEMATLNCGTINFGDAVFLNSRQDIRRLAIAIRGAGAVPELECYEIGHIQEGLSLMTEGMVDQPLHFQFVLGVPGAIPAREDVLHFMRSFVPPDATWTVAAVGRSQQPMTELAIRLGGHARVGLEDNIYLSRGVLSEGSAPLVARAAAYARSEGREPAEPAEARALLGIRQPRRSA